VTATQAHILLLEPTQNLDIGNNILLNLDPKPKPWKNILEKTKVGYASKQFYFFGKVDK
jgi:hypothetical protein